MRSAVYGELPGKVPPMLKTGRGAPAGLLIYNDTRFPEPYQGLLYYPDVFRKLVRAYRVAPRGSTFTSAPHGTCERKWSIRACIAAS